MLTSFPRSGTTLLEQVLDAHSQLVSSDEREAFARDVFPAMFLTPATPIPTAKLLDAIPMPRVAALRERYLAYMAAALNEPIGDRVGRRRRLLRRRTTAQRELDACELRPAPERPADQLVTATRAS